MRKEIIGLSYAFDAILILACASQEGMTERELKETRYEYKNARDKAIMLGIDVQEKGLPRTIKEKNLPYVLK